MTRPNSVTDSDLTLDARDILRASASLAAHFERLGLQFGPAPAASGIQQWAEQFAVEKASGPSPAPSKQSQPAPSPPLVRVSPTVRAGTASDGTVSKATPSGGTQSKAAAANSTGPVRPQPSANPAIRRDSVAPVTGAPVTGPTGAYPGQSLPVIQRTDRLSDLARVVAGCTRCDVLAKCRTQTVFGEGSVTPRVVFFGEAPGADEDRTGRPFVGLAGQLLSKMIQACSFAREDVYILNTIKCRPPGNRNPEPSELQNCREFFVSQLEVLRPEYIVCLGLVGSQALLSSTLSIGLLRGKFHKYHESKVVVTYHPAYLLRNPDAKKAAWDDLQMMLRDMGIQPGR